MKLRIAILLASFGAGSLQAATITWGTAMNVTSATDVSTNGTLVQAANMGTTTSYTVNGVVFTGNTSLWTGPSSGDFTSYGTHTVGGTYASALSSGRWVGGGQTATLALSGLTIGLQYELQIWLNDLRVKPNPEVITYTAGNSVTLTTDYNGGAGGTNLAQYAIGTFTADATTQNVTAVRVAPSDGGPTLNMFQLRSVPEPSAALLGGLGLLGLLRRRR